MIPANGTMTLLEAVRLVAKSETWSDYERDRSTETFDDVWDQFVATMVKGALVATGENDSSADVLAIEPSEWRVGRTRGDLDRNELQVQDRLFTNIAVRSCLRMPDVPRRLDGLDLAGAFHSLVLENPILVAAIQHAEGTRVQGPTQPYWFQCAGLLSGQYPGGSGAWPIDIDEVALASAWMEGGGSFAALQRDISGNELKPVRDAARVVAEAVRLFVRPLRAGALEASGYHAITNQIGPISPAIWTAPSTLIDAGGNLGEDRDETFHPKWTAVSFALAQVRPSPEVEIQVTPKNKGGRPGKYDWDKALLYLFEWIQHHGLPDSGGDMTSLVTQIIEQLGQGTPNRRQVEQECDKRLPALRHYLRDSEETTFPSFLLTLRPDKKPR